MADFRTGRSWGVTVVHDPERGEKTGELWATAQKQEYAERIVAALNGWDETALVDLLTAADRAWTGDDPSSPSYIQHLARCLVAGEALPYEPTSPIGGSEHESAVDSELRDRIMDAFDAHEWVGGDPANHGLSDFADVATTAIASVLAARDAADKLHKRELLDALGMNPLRDWDDIRNAAAGIRKDRYHLRSELERERSSRQDWAEEALRMTEERDVARHLVSRLADATIYNWCGWDDPNHDPRVLAEIATQTARKRRLALIHRNREYGQASATIGHLRAELARERAIKAEVVDTNRLAVQSLRGELDAYRHMLGCIWLYVDWRYVTLQLTTEQKELWADAVDGFGDPDENPRSKVDRWWRPVTEASEQVCGECKCALPFHKTWCNSIDTAGEQFRDEGVSLHSTAGNVREPESRSEQASHTPCADCGSRPWGSCRPGHRPCEIDASPATPAEPRVWRKGDRVVCAPDIERRYPGTVTGFNDWGQPLVKWDHWHAVDAYSPGNLAEVVEDQSGGDQ